MARKTVDSMPKLAKELGIHPATLRGSWVPAGMPRRKIGRGRFEYDVEEVRQWAERDGPWRPKEPADPLLSGSDSPNLEKYRHYRAELARLEFEERAGSLVPLERITRRWLGMFRVLRAFGDRLEQRFGRQAAEMYDALIEDMRRLAETD